ncbi:hypothetical protein NQ317_000305, partial [Molorchus minor]
MLLRRRKFWLYLMAILATNIWMHWKRLKRMASLYFAPNNTAHTVFSPLMCLFWTFKDRVSLSPCQVIIKGLRKSCGNGERSRCIQKHRPFNPNICPDWMFALSEVTDIERPDDLSENQPDPSNTHPESLSDLSEGLPIANLQEHTSQKTESDSENADPFAEDDDDDEAA